MSTFNCASKTASCQYPINFLILSLPIDKIFNSRNSTYTGLSFTCGRAVTTLIHLPSKSNSSSHVIIFSLFGSLISSKPSIKKINLPDFLHCSIQPSGTSMAASFITFSIHSFNEILLLLYFLSSINTGIVSLNPIIFLSFSADLTAIHCKKVVFPDPASPDIHTFFDISNKLSSKISLLYNSSANSNSTYAIDNKYLLYSLSNPPAPNKFI